MRHAMRNPALTFSDELARRWLIRFAAYGPRTFACSGWRPVPGVYMAMGSGHSVDFGSDFHEFDIHK